VIEQMSERVARIWEGDSETIAFSKEGVFTSLTNPSNTMTFKELAGRLVASGGPISGSANVNPRGAGPGFATHIVDVEVDPWTGKVDILRYLALQDVGRAVHPSYVEGQLQGGAVQGIGWALNEEYWYDDQGRMVNSTLLDYRMPTALDVPNIETMLVEVPNPGHPFGVRGVGEVNIVPPLAAIANAVSRALGIRMTTLPMSPGRVLEALWAKEASSSAPEEARPA
jgi:CO/xanthine dehydrogenase Mo-binding subunit